jgi:predicted AAA+ superfamily ATPase
MCMINSDLKQIYHRLLKRAGQLKKRKIVQTVKNELKEKPDIKVIRGLRGVGKTTALLQIINDASEKYFYFSADWPQIRQTSLYDACLNILKNGYLMIFIDEIHTYPEWESETKAIVDQFPETKLLVSGSAPVVFVGDRREKTYDMEPMDFSEFLFLKYDKQITTADDWMTENKSITATSDYYPQIEGWFKEYYQIGGFPCSLDHSFDNSLNAIFAAIKMSLEKDAVSFLKLSSPKILAMEKLLYFLATSQPGEINITSLSKNLAISKDSVYEIISALEKMKLIRIIKPHGSGSKLIRGEPKILFSHPNLRISICGKLGLQPKLGSIREELALFGFERRGFHSYTIKGAKKSPDYVIRKGENTFVVEIGGESKTKKQLEGFENSILIKDPQLMALLLI